MGAGGPRVGIVPGPGVVARFGPTIGVFAPDTGPDEPFTAAWLDRLARWEGGSTSTAEALAWEAAALLIEHRATAPAWASAIRIADGYLVLLHGAVRAQVDTPGGRIELSGAQDLTWVDRKIADPIARIALSLTPSGDIVADPRSDLRGGLVPSGSGLVLTVPAVPPVPGAPPATAGAVGTPHAAVPVSSPTPSPPPRPAPPKPALPRPAPPRPAPPTGPVPGQVRGPVPAPPPPGWSPQAPPPGWSSAAAPGRGENQPHSGPRPASAPTTIRPPFSAADHRPGPAADHRPGPIPAPPTGARPRADIPDETQVVTVSGGILVADDGTRTILDRAYVFGRDPGNDPAVVRGQATPIFVDDPDNLVSRVQSRVAVGGGVVTVSDANSSNGTYIAAPGAKDWSRVGPMPTVLPEGWSMRLGRRVYTHTAAAAASNAGNAGPGGVD